MNRRGFLRAFSVATASGLLMPAQAERLIYELNKPVSVSGAMVMDHTAYLQRLIDNAAGGFARIPSGVYRVSSTLVVGEDTRCEIADSRFIQAEKFKGGSILEFRGAQNVISNVQLTMR